MVDTSEYRVGVIQSLEGCGNCKSKVGKALKACRVLIDPNDNDESIMVVTSASNVREGSRIVVAPIGSSFLGPEGESRLVKRATIGGVISEGMFCDSHMLGWSGGGKGVAAQVPDSFPIGSAPPSSKPRKDKEIEDELAKEQEIQTKEPEGLFEKKLSKEEKKKLAEEKRKARKAAKAAKAAESEAKA
mmetsp:Transcript_48682/g.72240  ORF Transcript_48682/g.72240 Transcript_48682/m.72240 type:complete len:188 (+) Transcript_48682:174-737(+)|eukprot:CAMPEP_0195517990 /NCGR_PEP_ID=MMETSP0794_2-20130614/11888_1 /TAXON_ID=515487 /ORGANISM="Stephanopyxis turris, Strain CCMP 815" /LENGTH=187 /DNA_ID=CAMNT_0040646879 /DNA_START=153 /DNA_END=716 /DNA_ORIENTATION=-